jgi:hypothetical protein
MTGPDGTTLPLTIVPQGTMLPPDRVIVRVGDVQLTAGQLDQILEAYPENQRVFVNGPGRQQFIEQLVRVLLLSQEGKRRKLDQSDSYAIKLRTLRSASWPTTPKGTSGRASRSTTPCSRDTCRRTGWNTYNCACAIS